MTTEKELEAAMQANQKEMEALLLAVGQSISDWALVEEGLFEIFCRFMASPALGPPSCAFTAIDNLRSKIQMVDSMVRHSKAGRKVLPEWEKLHKRCDRSRTARNALVHRRAVTFQIGSGKAQAALLAYKYDIRSALEEEYSIPSHLKIDHVKNLSNQFRELGADLLQFAHSIPSPPSEANTSS